MFAPLFPSSVDSPRKRPPTSRLSPGERLEQRHALAVVLSMTGPTDPVPEGQQATFSLRLSEASRVPQRVTVTTAPGTATYGVDYFAPLKQTILFAPGQTTQTFSIATLRDAGGDRTEGRETFTVIVTPENRTVRAPQSRLVTIADVSGPSGPPSRFQIAFTYDSSVTDSVKAQLKQAADRWSNVIVGDLPDVTYQGRKIDDIEIAVKVVEAASLPAGVIAQAGFDQLRPGAKGLPFLGSMEISAAFLTAPGLRNTLAHEIGHSLGFGTLWQAVPAFQPLVSGIGTSNPVYVGTNGVREYNTLFGTSGTTAPLFEVSASTPPAYGGSYGVHWRDSVFNASTNNYFELMTSRYNITGSLNGGPIPAVLSRATVGVMQDLGYVVSYGNAEKYTKPNNAPAAPARPSGGTGGNAAAPQRDMVRSLAFSTNVLPAGNGTGAGPTSPAAGFRGARGQTGAAVRPRHDGGHRLDLPEPRGTTAADAVRPASLTARGSQPIFVGSIRPATALVSPRLRG